MRVKTFSKPDLAQDATLSRTASGTIARETITVNPYVYRRRTTRVVMVGKVAVGGDNPIRVQSMTTTLTKDIEATVAQTARLVAAGCEIVRITTPTPADARSLGPIKEGLAARGIDVPIVADIHFNPLAALAAADFADKVRVNPGNYADSRKFAIREYTDQEYGAELTRIEEKFVPLVLKCKERGIAMRIGTNHGSLSDRIMNRFGDTPEGMVESALEFVRICEEHDYRDIILSMKASNPKVMIAAYRLLAASLASEGMDYPFHLGVTEAGNAEDGRIKSAIGIGSLLEDGIGDTIRVSLTEEPEAEIPVALSLAGRYSGRTAGRSPASSPAPSWDPHHYERRVARELAIAGVSVGGSQTIGVIAPVDGPLVQQKTGVARALQWASPAGRRQPKPDAALFCLETEGDLQAFKALANRLTKWPQAQLTTIVAGADPVLLLDALPHADAVLCSIRQVEGMSALVVAVGDAGKALILEAEVGDGGWDSTVEALVEAAREASEAGSTPAVTLRASPEDSVHAYRLLAASLAAEDLEVPIILQAFAQEGELLEPAIMLGSPLCDGIGDAVMITGLEDSSPLAFNILQAAGARIFKTDYVACPSCGRTLFDLEETTDRIKRRTSHLVGVKLAIMGCIVNGPGEMADADFGYVGGAPGQVNLYVGKECVEKGVPAEEADDRLIELIKERGKWVEDDEEAQSPSVLEHR
jgi:(E)-4-hydroxy-3-methylbut-2-enyl-diphosphate synthase